jgi:hypothetical protein
MCFYVTPIIIIVITIVIGHASLIGEKTKKCVGFSVKSKKCRICDSAKQRNVPVREHNCHHNWSGSAKAMEPAMACEMVQNIMDHGEKVCIVKILCVMLPV